ncbi:TetR/AcrR family transcriptional regulator [Corynebacterium renale]|uniref:TetR/AcrR family transcriptional regulator n=1 Tax=Corynebacterium renale TaxID=1724 RepID=UPI000DFF5107|nr:TetR/AcrR family transcriptional regulator [Corynebacterium renale]STC98499.1 TetR family transcriptional regulator [Corynebacterium renale]
MKQRRRGAELEQALMQAAWKELIESGYSNMTMDAVATRAHTSRAVLYRRWSDKDELVRATIDYFLQSNTLNPQDTGSLRGDLLDFYKLANSFADDSFTLPRLHLSGVDMEPEDSAIAAILPTTAFTIYRRCIERAIDRGEIPPGEDSRYRARAGISVLRDAMITHRGPVPENVLEDIIDDVTIPLIKQDHPH